jgi:hypothetical protein
MSYFSNLDTAIQEKKQGRGRENIAVGSLGVCLEDTGQPVKLYIVDFIFVHGSINVYPLDKEGPAYGFPRQIKACDFWALT